MTKTYDNVQWQCTGCGATAYTDSYYNPPTSSKHRWGEIKVNSYTSIWHLCPGCIKIMINSLPAHGSLKQMYDRGMFNKEPVRKVEDIVTYIYEDEEESGLELVRRPRGSSEEQDKRTLP